MAADKTSTNYFTSHQQPDFYRGQGDLDTGSPLHAASCNGLGDIHMEEHPWSPWVGVTWGSSQEGSERGKGRKVKKKRKLQGKKRQDQESSRSQGITTGVAGRTAQEQRHRLMPAWGGGEDRAGER